MPSGGSTREGGRPGRSGAWPAGMWARHRHRGAGGHFTGRWRFERVVRRRRRQRPLERVRAVPRPGRGLFALAAGALHHRIQEQELRRPEPEGADRREHVPVGELLRVVGNAARHPGETQEVHREERHVERDQRRPEMDFAERLVVHRAGPLRDPVVRAAEEREQAARDHHVVEVGDDVVGVLGLHVDRHDREHEAGEAAQREQEQEADREEHRRLEGHRARATSWPAS